MKQRFRSRKLWLAVGLILAAAIGLVFPHRAVLFTPKAEVASQAAQWLTEKYGKEFEVTGVEPVVSLLGADYEWFNVQCSDGTVSFCTRVFVRGGISDSYGVERLYQAAQNAIRAQAEKAGLVLDRVVISPNGLYDGELSDRFLEVDPDTPVSSLCTIQHISLKDVPSQEDGLHRIQQLLAGLESEAGMSLDSVGFFFRLKDSQDYCILRTGTLAVQQQTVSDIMVSSM